MSLPCESNPFVPSLLSPYPAIVVESDVPLNGGDALLLGDLVLVSDMHQNASGLTLHLDNDLGESSLTNLLQFRQHARTEHDLGGNE